MTGSMTKALKKPTRVANDADMQGGAVVSGRGVELVLTSARPVAGNARSVAAVAPKIVCRKNFIMVALRLRPGKPFYRNALAAISRRNCAPSNSRNGSLASSP